VFGRAHGISIFTAGLQPFVAEFHLGVPPERFVAGESLYLFGIAFAPYWVPHLAERTGRVPVYFGTMTCALLFNLGAGLSHTIGGVLACRFFAGFFGGPSLVLLEGTFADMWSARRTNTYYSIQAFAAFFGAGFGTMGMC
jgi:MFS family permease